MQLNLVAVHLETVFHDNPHFAFVTSNLMLPNRSMHHPPQTTQKPVSYWNASAADERIENNFVYSTPTRDVSLQVTSPVASLHDAQTDSD